MWVPLDVLMEGPTPRQWAAGRGKTTAQRVPVMVAHCMLRVKDKGKNARAAWNICRASMTKHGYMKPPYDEGGTVAGLRPTVQGTRRGMKHAMERDAPEKFKRFKAMIRKIEPSMRGQA